MTLANGARAAALLAAAVLVAHHSNAAAQSADAEVLFREGRKLIKAGRLGPGCDKLEASERIESSIGTLLNLGDCREKLGQTASAWAAFRKAEAMARRENDVDRRKEAEKRAAQVEPRLLYLVIQVDKRVDGLTVRREEEVIEPAAYATPLPVDPGSYTIVAEAPGYKPWRTEVPIDAKLRRRVVVVPGLERAPVVVAPAPASPVVAATPVVPARAEPITIVQRRTPTWSAARKVSLVVALAGLGASGTGLYFGWRARELSDRADERCPLAVCADPAALRDSDRASTLALRANILYAAGGGALAVAAVLWLAGKPDEETVVVPAVGPGEAGVSLARRF